MYACFAIIPHIMPDVEKGKDGKERKESPTQRAWKALYSGISADANTRNLPADRLRYRQDIEYRGFNEQQSEYDVRVACYSVDHLGRPRVVVADVYEDGTHIQQVFSEGVWTDNRLGISLTPSKTDRSFARFSLSEIGMYAGEIVQSSILENAVEEAALGGDDVTHGETIFPVPMPKAGDAPN